METFHLIKFILLINAPARVLCQSTLPVWAYECRDSKCIRTYLGASNSPQGHMVCRMLCGDEIETLWPKPTGLLNRGKQVIKINRNFQFNIPKKSATVSLWKTVEERFRLKIDNKIPEVGLLPNAHTALRIRITLNEPDTTKLTYETDESYSLRIKGEGSLVFADISALNFFGARHGLETLSQLIVYDDFEQCIQILADTEISDAPVYKHRGIHLDTGSNYFSVTAIKRTIDTMAMSKLNTLHWSIINPKSFPFVVTSHTDFHSYGAFSLRKIYTHQDIVDIVRYARTRGVRVIPEFDIFQNAAKGWRDLDMAICDNGEPMALTHLELCELDPTADKIFNILEDIYVEMLNAFEPEIFHMGSLDLVSFDIWNCSTRIRNWMTSRGMHLDSDGFRKLLGSFLTNARLKIDAVSKNKQIQIIVYSNSFNEIIQKSFDESRLIIQTTKSTLEPGFALGSKSILTISDIFVHSDRYVQLGSWKVFYEKRERIRNERILGYEAKFQSFDEYSMESTMWPRASALGERLWSNTDEPWSRAKIRYFVHRQSLIESGIRAHAEIPEWCFMNLNECI